jgi:hypothetical protein
VDRVDILPPTTDSTGSRLTEAEREEEGEYLALLSGFLVLGGFYYSPGYDLTTSLQSHYHNGNQPTSFMDITKAVHHII